MKKKILIIEDDAIMAHIYRSRLEKEDYEVEVANDGQNGFYRIHEFRPDAVLLDLMLPKIGGVDILKKIRAQSQFQALPVVVFTNAYVPNMIQDAMAAGATQVFNKATLTPRRFMEALLPILNAIKSPAHPPSANATQQFTKPAPTPASNGREMDRTAMLGDAPFNAAPPAASAPPATAPAPVQPAALPCDLPVDFPNVSGNDQEFQAELLRMFVDSAPETMIILRKYLQEFSKAQEDASRLPGLLELYRRIHALTGSAGIAGLKAISQLAAALEVLLKELHDKPKNINVSTTRTVTLAIDFLGELFQKGLNLDWTDYSDASILVVDDEVLSRRAIAYALEKASLKCTSVEDSQVALNLAQERSFDLVFLDVQMPGMDGFDLCAKIRALPHNKSVPVVFVTTLTDFTSRARSTLSGGNDLIAKPFMFIEMSVKALTYVLRGQLAKRLNQEQQPQQAAA